MINLSNLTIKNFMSIESMSLDFKKDGIYIISGYNIKGGDSNGSGKSTILNSIIWGLFGRTAKGLDVEGVHRWECGEPTEVVLSFTEGIGGTEGDSGHTWRIVRSTDSLDFYIDGQKTRGHKRDIQASINDTFKTSYDLFLSSVSFTKGQSDFLTDAGDAAKKRLFKSLLGLEKIDKMYDKAKDIYGALMTEASQWESGIKTIQDRVSRLQSTIETYNYKNKVWEATKSKKIEELVTMLEGSAPDIDPSLEDKLVSKENKYIDFENRVQNEEELVQGEQATLTKTYGDRAYIKVQIEEANKLLNDIKEMKGTTCKYCGSPIVEEDKEAHIEEIEEFLEGLNLRLIKKDSFIKSLENRIWNLSNLKEELKQIEGEYHKINNLVTTQRRNIEVFHERKTQTEARIRAEREAENPYLALLESSKIELQSQESTLQELQVKFRDTCKLIDTYAYIKWVLSREGVVAAIIERVFKRLEILINSYLSSICSEGFRLKIEPKRELKSGAFKDEIEIVVTQGDKKIPYAGLSGGQEQRVTIAILLALYFLSRELGMNHFSFLLLDEVIDLSLAEKGQQDIMKLLETLRVSIKHIFLISHKDGLSSDQAINLEVIRGMDGITRLT